MLGLLQLDRIEGHTFVADWIGPGSIILDCGMNEGRFAATISERYGCAVVGIEANPALARQNAAQRGLVCHNAAVTDREREVIFRVDEADNTASSIVADRPSGAAGTVSVQGLGLADCLARFASRPPSLLKLDIEGAELDAILACPGEALREIEQISIEFHVFIDAGMGPRAQQVIDRLSGLGFYHLDFSRCLMNVLFINERLRPLGQTEKASLHALKYVSGIRRMMGLGEHAGR